MAVFLVVSCDQPGCDATAASWQYGSGPVSVGREFDARYGGRFAELGWKRVRVENPNPEHRLRWPTVARVYCPDHATAAQRKRASA